MVIRKLMVSGKRIEGQTLKDVCRDYSGMKCYLIVHTASDRFIKIGISKKEAVRLLESNDFDLTVHCGSKLWLLGI